MKSLPKPIAIIGMGLSGEATKRLLDARGEDQYFTFDSKPGLAEVSDPQEVRSRAPGTLIVSPGVPLALPWIQDLVNAGVYLTSELALAVEHLETEKIIGVTGSVGKSTTVSLLEAALLTFSPDSFVGGNIGKPLADYVADRILGKRPMAPWVVLELSSYQLENAGRLKLDYSAITYLTPNHLERYSDLQSYYDTKWQIIERTRTAFFANKRGGDLADYLAKKKNPLLPAFTDHTDSRWKKRDLSKAALIGLHNQDNLALACLIAETCKWPEAAFYGMWKFSGLPHRMQTIGTFGGVKFINDSKATTMESVRTAVEGIYPILQKKEKLWLLLGGKDKNLPWEELRILQKFPQLRVAYFGQCGDRAKQGASIPGNLYPMLKSAVQAVTEEVSQGDIVLLSPGGTSWDEFKNFEERGQKFREYVESSAKR